MKPRNYFLNEEAMAFLNQLPISFHDKLIFDLHHSILQKQRCHIQFHLAVNVECDLLHVHPNHKPDHHFCQFPIKFYPVRGCAHPSYCLAEMHSSINEKKRALKYRENC